MSKQYQQKSYDFTTASDLESTVETLKDTYHAEKKPENSKVLCMLDDGDTWLQDYDRTPVVVYKDDEPVTASAVSSRDTYYTVTQFHTPFEALTEALNVRDGDVDVKGRITVGKYCKRLTSNIRFTDMTVSDPTGNDVELGLRVNTAHNGFSAVNIEIGALRLICSNGMVAWDSKYSFKHKHNEGPFRMDYMYQSIESVLNSTDRVAERFERAHEEKFNSKDEMLLVLLDCGFNWIFDNPVEALYDSFDAEVSWHNNPEQMRNEPSLYDAYTVGTYAIDHVAKDDSSEHAIDTARNRLKMLLETYEGEIPEAEKLVTKSVENRTESMMDEDVEMSQEEKSIVRRVSSSA